MIKRREMLLGMAAGLGAPLGLSLVPGNAQAANDSAIKAAGSPKRVIFFL
jgi:hypothetical protein